MTIQKKFDRETANSNQNQIVYAEKRIGCKNIRAFYLHD